MGVQAVGEAVALKTFGAILLGNDVWLLSGVKESPQAKGMVYMPVCVDNGVQGCLAPGPDSIVDGLRVLGEARVEDIPLRRSFLSLRAERSNLPFNERIPSRR
jgi:hypothetical protein